MRSKLQLEILEVGTHPHFAPRHVPALDPTELEPDERLAVVVTPRHRNPLAIETTQLFARHEPQDPARLVVCERARHDRLVVARSNIQPHDFSEIALDHDVPEAILLPLAARGAAFAFGPPFSHHGLER